MSGTTNLNVTYIQAAQTQKEVTANAAFDRLDKALTETFVADLTSGNVTLTSTQYRECLVVQASNATTAGRTVTLPAVERIVLLRGSSGNTQTVGFVRGSTTITVSPGQTQIVRTDGTTDGLFSLLAGQLAEIWVAASDEGTAIETGAGKVHLRAPFAMNVSSVRASLRSACATGTFTVDINVNGSSILSTKLTVDATELTSTTAAVPAVISSASIGDDALITIDVDDEGDGTATGLKVLLKGTRA